MNNLPQLPVNERWNLDLNLGRLALESVPSPVPSCLVVRVPGRCLLFGDHTLCFCFLHGFNSDNGFTGDQQRWDDKLTDLLESQELTFQLKEPRSSSLGPSRHRPTEG